jgi:hypothetical protein
VIKRLNCKIGGCECHNGAEDFTVEVDTEKRMFTLPEFFCTACLGQLYVSLISEEIIDPMEIPNAG